MVILSREETTFNGLTFKGIGQFDCHCGEGTVTCEGHFATGLPLEFHTPEVNELVKNIWMECDTCDFNQAS